PASDRYLTCLLSEDSLIVKASRTVRNSTASTPANKAQSSRRRCGWITGSNFGVVAELDTCSTTRKTGAPQRINPPFAPQCNTTGDHPGNWECKGHLGPNVQRKRYKE